MLLRITAAVLLTGAAAAEGLRGVPMNHSQPRSLLSNRGTPSHWTKTAAYGGAQNHGLCGKTKKKCKWFRCRTRTTYWHCGKGEIAKKYWPNEGFDDFASHLTWGVDKCTLGLWHPNRKDKVIGMLGFDYHHGAGQLSFEYGNSDASGKVSINIGEAQKERISKVKICYDNKYVRGVTFYFSQDRTPVEYGGNGPYCNELLIPGGSELKAFHGSAVRDKGISSLGFYHGPIGAGIEEPTPSPTTASPTTAAPTTATPTVNRVQYEYEYSSSDYSSSDYSSSDYSTTDVLLPTLSPTPEPRTCVDTRGSGRGPHGGDRRGSYDHRNGVSSQCAYYKRKGECLLWGPSGCRKTCGLCE